jgi:hypothetical protein
MLRPQLAAAVAAFLLAAPANAADRCAPQIVEILSDPEIRTFAIEIADDAGEQARGLMFRQALATDAGMLFIFEPPRPANFWMRNTTIPARSRASPSATILIPNGFPRHKAMCGPCSRSTVACRANSASAPVHR